MCPSNNITLVDSHCHLDRLDLTRFDSNLDAVLNDARQRGVKHFLCIGISADNAEVVRELARRYPDVDCSVGVHPLDLQQEWQPDLDWLLAQVNQPEVIAVGETGLDYYYQQENAKLQQQSFALHLEAARITGKPVIVHSREARADTIALLAQADLPHTGVMHCFTEDWDMARKALDLGYYISFSGIVTFRNADMLREVALKVPADRILVETDAPYLAPVPHRGKPNYPGNVADVAAFLAQLRQVDYAEFTAQTTANFKRLFPLAKLKPSV